MTAPTPLTFEPVNRLCDRMSQGEVSSVDIFSVYLDGIAHYNDKLHAYIEVYSIPAGLGD